MIRWWILWKKYHYNIEEILAISMETFKINNCRNIFKFQSNQSLQFKNIFSNHGVTIFQKESHG